MKAKDVKKTRNDKVQIGAWLNRDIYAKAVEIAKTKELTFSDILRMAIKEYIAREEKRD